MTTYNVYNYFNIITVFHKKINIRLLDLIRALISNFSLNQSFILRYYRLDIQLFHHVMENCEY